MHENWMHDYMTDLDNREYDEPEISDEEFFRSIAFFWEGVPDEDQR
jgi:hypothetical protein